MNGNRGRGGNQTPGQNQRGPHTMAGAEELTGSNPILAACELCCAHSATATGRYCRRCSAFLFTGPTLCVHGIVADTCRHVDCWTVEEVEREHGWSCPKCGQGFQVVCRHRLTVVGDGS